MAIDADSGQQKWSLKTGEDLTIHNQVGFQSSAAVVDGTVYVGCRDAHVYAVDAATGHKKWDYPTSKSWVIGTPAVGDAWFMWARLTALVSWPSMLRRDDYGRTSMRKRICSRPPRWLGAWLYVGDHNGKLYAIDAKSFKLVWEFQTEASKSNSSKVLTRTAV